MQVQVIAYTSPVWLTQVDDAGAPATSRRFESGYMGKLLGVGVRDLDHPINPHFLVLTEVDGCAYIGIVKIAAVRCLDAFIDIPEERVTRLLDVLKRDGGFVAIPASGAARQALDTAKLFDALNSIFDVDKLATMFRETFLPPPAVQATYIGDVTTTDPETKEDVTLHVWKNPQTGTYVAIDNMELDVNRNGIPDPYQPGTRLRFHDTFTGLPK